MVKNPNQGVHKENFQFLKTNQKSAFSKRLKNIRKRLKNG
jgi:hypothetical protein